MNNILDILKTKNPEFYNQLKKAFDEASYELRTDEGMQTTIIADNIQLTSHHDRMHCAEYRCRKLDLNEPISIYGMGLGDEIRYILEKNPKANINLFILNEALFYFLVQNIEDFTDLLATNVNLIIADDDTPYVKNSIIIPSEVYIDFKHNNKIVQVEEIGWGEVIMHTSPTERVRTTWKEVDKLKMEYVTTVRSLKAPLSFNGRYE